MKFVPPQLSGKTSLAAVVEDDGMAIRSELSRPGRVGERLAEQHLPGDAVQHVEESVAVRHHHDLATLAANGEVGQHRHVVRVPVVQCRAG